jgi:hypothetical protein
MTNVTIKPTASRQASLDDIATVSARLLTLSLENSLAMMRQASTLLAVLPDLRPRRAQDACCEIPETDCPPRCVCETRWQANPREATGMSVRVTNSSATDRTYVLHATPFIGPDGSPGLINLEPATLTLAPGQVGMVEATFTVPDIPEGTFDAEIVIRGAYEQAVCVRLVVKCEKSSSAGRGICDVVQGDPPVRIRAHHWYDHFQCTEPCFDRRHEVGEPRVVA